MADKAKHAHGSRKNLEAAIASKAVDAFDVLFLSGEDENPAMGWLDKNGNPIIISPADEVAKLETQVEAAIATKADFADVEALEGQIATKVDAAEVDVKVSQAVTDSVASANAYTDKMVEAAMGEHLTKKYEVANVPEGTLIDYRESEIRVMCPVNAQWAKQSVGAGGDANSYYMTFKTYVPSDAVVGYIEHMNGQSDSEILTKFSVDEYGRRYQPTWLALAKYDEATDTWTYYGANSNKDRYIGWNYQIDWYDANDVMIASDSIRINLSNEDCHSEIKPYYVGDMMKTANAYTDAQIEAKIAEMNAIEVIEF